MSRICPPVRLIVQTGREVGLGGLARVEIAICLRKCMVQALGTGYEANGYGAHSPENFDLIAAFITEVVLTFFLVFTVLGATDTKAPVGFAGLAIGLVLTLIHLVGIPVTNTSVNPARSIGPAVFVGGWALGQLWLFIVAPLIGAAVAAVAYQMIRISEPIIPARRAESALPSEQLERSI